MTIVLFITGIISKRINGYWQEVICHRLWFLREHCNITHKGIHENHRTRYAEWPKVPTATTWGLWISCCIVVSQLIQGTTNRQDRHYVVDNARSFQSTNLKNNMKLVSLNKSISLLKSTKQVFFNKTTRPYSCDPADQLSIPILWQSASLISGVLRNIDIISQVLHGQWNVESWFNLESLANNGKTRVLCINNYKLC